MTAEATLPAAGSAATLPRRSLGTLIAISIFWFALNFHWSALLILLVPDQVIGLLLHEAPAGTLASQATWVDQHKSLTLALVLAPGLVVALIANPLFGLFSDRTRGRFGRRRPYILGGTLLNVVGLGVMALAPLAFIQGGSANPLPPSILILTAGLMLTQLANNAAAAPFHALLPDIVPQEQRGLASGIMGSALLLGQIGGVLVVSVFGFNSSALLDGTQDFVTYQQGIITAYIAVAGVVALMAVLTALTVRETPWRPSVLAATSVAQQALERAARNRTLRDLFLTVLAVLAVVGGALILFQANIGITLNDGSLSILQLVAVVVAGVGAARAFDFRPRRNPDFTWVVLTRMLVVMGVQLVQTFLNFYMKDVVHADSPESASTLFVIILTVGALVSTIFAGWGSDRIGRKRMVYISGAFMAAVGAAFVIAPYVITSSLLPLILGAGAIFGLGYGAYLAVDWALVADVLPSDATFARDMGVWNIGLTIPQVMAAVIGGWLLALGGLVGGTQLGYNFLFIGFVVFCVLGTVTVRYIKGVKR
jgi:MFS family permease